MCGLSPLALWAPQPCTGGGKRRLKETGKHCPGTITFTHFLSLFPAYLSKSLLRPRLAGGGGGGGYIDWCISDVLLTGTQQYISSRGFVQLNIF